MDTGLYFSCEIDGLPERAIDIVDFTLEEGLSTLFTLTINVASNNPDIDLDAQLLKKTSFTVWVNAKKKRTVNGIIAAAVRGDVGFKKTYYTFQIRPEFWLLTLTMDSRIFHFKNVPEILNQLLDLYQVKVSSQLMDPHPAREYTVQKRESYYDFFCRLAAEEGIMFWFEEEGLFYSDSHLGMKAGTSVIYNPHTQSATKESVVSQLRFGAFMRSNEAQIKDYKYSHPDVGLKFTSEAAPTRLVYSTYDSYGRFDDEKTAQQFSNYRLEALQADSASGTGKSNCFELMPGEIFSLAEHPTAAMNARWQIVNIVHKGTLPQSLADESGDAPATLSNEFSFIPGANDWRPPYIHKPLVDGDEVAVVVGPAGEEIYVNEDGAVKVHFHWNRNDAADENASCWVRVSQNWNGNGFGFLATPRIGQEVLISYLNGDIDRPIITGTVYNGNNRPPLNLPAAKTQMSIKSKTHKGDGFNELRFEDENGKEEVFLHAQKDMNTKVLDNRSTDVGTNHSETVGGNQTVTVQKNQVETVVGNQMVTVKKNKVETVTLSSNELIGMAKTLSVGAGYAVTVAAAMNTAVGLSQSEEVGVSKQILVGEKLEMIAGELIEIRCGKSLIRMSKEGRVEIKGLDIVFDNYEPHHDARYKRQFVLKTDEGEIVAGQKYRVKMAEGNEFIGVTNQQGETAIYSTDDVEAIEFEMID